MRRRPRRVRLQQCQHCLAVRRKLSRALQIMQRRSSHAAISIAQEAWCTDLPQTRVWLRAKARVQVATLIAVRTCEEKRASVATSLYSSRFAAVARPRQALRKQTASSDVARRARAAATSSSAASSRGDGSVSLRIKHLTLSTPEQVLGPRDEQETDGISEHVP